jgi:hypothetical protein
MTEPINGRELLAIRARAARAQNGQHQSLRQTEADRHALVAEVYRLRDELAGHVGCRADLSIGAALRLMRNEESDPPAPCPVSAATGEEDET